MLTDAAEYVGLKGSQLPRIGTPRREHLATFGPSAARLMELIGVELMPWQTHTLDVGMEVLPGNRWRSRTNSVVVARQNGKSRGILMPRVMAELFLPQLWFNNRPGYVIHQAQDRALPREHFVELVEKIEDTPSLMRQVRKIEWTNGRETLRMKSGAVYTLKAPTRGAGRGPSATLLMWDEVREQRDFAAWEAAFFTISAMRSPQVWTVSNAGDPDSLLLNQLRDRGRPAATDPDSDPTMTYLEWSAPDEAEITDPDGWRHANPALGHTLPVDSIFEELKNVEESGFRTERLCQWVDVAVSLAVPADAWRACHTDEPERDPDSRPWLAFDIDQDGLRAVLVAASWHAGRLVCEVLESWDDGTPVDHATIAARVLDWYRANQARGIAYDPLLGTAIADRIAPRIGNAKKRLLKVSGHDWYAACSQLLDNVKQGIIWHADDPTLNSDILAAARKDVGDGAWQITRRDAAQPIPAATAITRAVHLAVKPRPVPNVH